MRIYNVLFTTGESWPTWANSAQDALRRAREDVPALVAKSAETDEEEHECDYSGEVDNDICPSCGEHTGVCSECGRTECCG